MGTCIFLIINLFGQTVGFLLIQSAPRTVTKILTVGNGGHWGTWQTPHFCSRGSYAVGYSLKIEAYQPNQDNTALNAVQLHCGYINTTGSGGEVTSGTDPWGRWVVDLNCGERNGLKLCLTSFIVQVEKSQMNGDNTAANYVRFKCRDFGGQTNEIEISQGFGHSGTFGNWSGSCPPNSAICGIRTKIEEPFGTDGDETALNDMELFCCND